MIIRSPPKRQRFLSPRGKEFCRCIEVEEEEKSNTQSTENTHLEPIASTFNDIYEISEEEYEQELESAQGVQLQR